MFWRSKLLFLVIIVGIPTIAYLIAVRQAKVYQSSVLGEENTLPVDTSLFTTDSAIATPTSPYAEALGGQGRAIETGAVAKVAAAVVLSFRDRLFRKEVGSQADLGRVRDG